MAMQKVFLGGTYGSTWRERLIPFLALDYFNPVVADWTPECQERELRERETADFVLYTVTPQMTGVYSVAEVVDDSNKRPDKTVLCVLEQDGDKTFSQAQKKSLDAVAAMVLRNGGYATTTIEDAARYLNAQIDTGEYVACADELPPEGESVMTKIDDAAGVRNEQRLSRQGRLWWMPNHSMYVYYVPTHWMRKLST